MKTGKLRYEFTKNAKHCLAFCYLGNGRWCLPSSGKDNFVSRYQLYLPDTEVLKQELRRLLVVNDG
ncbi:hypothetical protein LC613_43250 [Nostoc sphaeroides CHAB 2801]|uniref:hypothetical protein n=1 Tax=Nostoc sphaeroides TaxID=446679 RepID=UPI001E5B6B86|nr:hypothetical protein [Nostoc sphaeroides]MCC5634221.1 hypothetical protein [Nostoc sphaeroides CHAB 2801]